MEPWLLTVYPYLKSKESYARYAYPDPMSDLGVAMRKKFGADATDRIGHGTLAIPQNLVVLSGSPWTVGFGQTGPNITRHSEMSMAEAERALTTSILYFHRKMLEVYPGSERLHPKAQAALVSLLYNRGFSMAEIDSRREMRELRPAIILRQYLVMRDLILSMKRIWAGKNMRGLLTRREEEAHMCQEAYEETHDG